MGTTLEKFIEDLNRSGLLSAEEIGAFCDALPPARRPTAARQLARQLVAAGRLTRYQAAAAVQGKAQCLVFAEYVILGRLGRGGMGVVLKAEHRRMKRPVAIKIITPEHMTSPDVVRRFYREVEAAARLSHPNIVVAHDASEHLGTHYLVMEYVEGQDLATVARDYGPLPVYAVVECILQAARGLQYAHEQGIIHRDIKPSNLLLDIRGTVRVLDLGLARIDQSVRGQHTDRLTNSGQVMGTGDYMAPEQALNTHRADARSDIYSLGCTLYRLLAGIPPYHGKTFTQLFMAHLETPPPSLCAARPDVPPTLDALFQQMVAKMADDRPQTMRHVIDALEAIQRSARGADFDDETLRKGVFAFLRAPGAGSPQREQSSSPLEVTLNDGRHSRSSTDRQAGWRRTPRRVWVALGLAAAVLVLLGVALAVQSAPRSETPGGSITPPLNAAHAK
jgi:serine/threonine protein kinase